VATAGLAGVGVCDATFSPDVDRQNAVHTASSERGQTCRTIPERFRGVELSGFGLEPCTLSPMIISRKL
jgi:hypothetical protein